MRELVENLTTLVMMMVFLMLVAAVKIMAMELRITRLESSDRVFRKIVLLKILATMKPTTGLLEEKRIKFLHRKEAFLEELTKNSGLMDQLWMQIDFSKEELFI